MHPRAIIIAILISTAAMGQGVQIGAISADALYLGTTSIKAVYLGTNAVWTSGPPATSYIVVSGGPPEFDFFNGDYFESGTYNGGAYHEHKDGGAHIWRRTDDGPAHYVISAALGVAGLGGFAGSADQVPGEYAGYGECTDATATVSTP